MKRSMQWIQGLWAAGKVLWGKLPHQAQAAIVVFVSTAGTTLGKELQELLVGSPSFTWLTLRHDISAAVLAGVVAGKAFYMLPNLLALKPAELPPAEPDPK